MFLTLHCKLTRNLNKGTNLIMPHSWHMCAFFVSLDAVCFSLVLG